MPWPQAEGRGGAAARRDRVAAGAVPLLAGTAWLPAEGRAGAAGARNAPGAADPSACRTRPRGGPHGCRPRAGAVPLLAGNRGPLAGPTVRCHHGHVFHAVRAGTPLSVALRSRSPEVTTTADTVAVLNGGRTRYGSPRCATAVTGRVVLRPGARRGLAGPPSAGDGRRPPSAA
ncbi:hypothetical protein GCM10010273_11090 [Streptomyces lavendulocolor]